MRVLARSLLALLLVGLATGKVSSQTATTHAVTAAEYERWKTDLSNWGRWLSLIHISEPTRPY